MILKIFSALLLSAVAFSLWVVWKPVHVSVDMMRTVELKGERILVTVAETEKERREGLSGRATLPPNEGMLFIFSTPGMYGFWMKDMAFPIDILWLDSDKKIMTIKKNVSPSTYPEVLYPEGDALYVLELPAGFADAHGVALGDAPAFLF